MFAEHPKGGLPKQIIEINPTILPHAVKKK